MNIIRSAATTLVLLTPLQAPASTVDILFESTLEASDSQRLLLSEAEQFWENTLVGYQPGIEIDQVTIDIGAFDIDGERGSLAQGGPGTVVRQSGYVLPTSGFIEFDTADLDRLEAGGSLLGLFLHEVGHVLGFGTLWTENNLYVDDSGQYKAANGLAAYREEFDPTAPFVPVEMDGGPGTRNAHWDETWAGGENELMTGFIDLPLFLSDTTAASFRDLGYVTQTASEPPPVAVIPLPAPFWLGLGALSALGLLGRRRRRAA